MPESERGKGRHDKNLALLIGLRHELRRRIMLLMRDGREASPCEIAEILGEGVSNVSYHVRVLAECGALNPTVNKAVRGATKHFYRWSLEAKWARTMLEEEED